MKPGPGTAGTLSCVASLAPSQEGAAFGGMSRTANPAGRPAKHDGRIAIMGYTCRFALCDLLTALSYPFRVTTSNSMAAVHTLMRDLLCATQFLRI